MSTVRPTLVVCIISAIVSLTACTSAGSDRPPDSPSRSSGTPSASPTGAAACRTSANADKDVVAPKVSGAVPNAKIPVVNGRCNRQVDLTGPGINFTGMQTFGVNGGSVEIAASNWYTIGATSGVPADISVVVDPVITHTPTNQRRFQYLGDLLALVGQPTFCPSGLFAIRSPGSYLVIGVVRNSGYGTLRLHGLHVTLTESPPTRIVGDTVLFASGEGLTLPANSMYFFETTLSANGVPDAKAVTDSFNFHWDTLLPAGTEHCG